MRVLKKITILFYISVIPLLSNGQTIIFQEAFGDSEKLDNINNERKTGNLSLAKSDFDYEDLSPVSNQNVNYIIPAFDISEGVALMTFNLKQDISLHGKNGLRVFYKSDTTSGWNLLAFYSQSEIQWKKVTLFLPENSSTYSIKFIGTGNNGDIILLDNIQVDFFADAFAYSEGRNIYIDTINNFSSTFLKFVVSDYQISGLPFDNIIGMQTRTPGIPVTCPGNAIIEGEPDCYTNYNDTYNSGCPSAFSLIYGCNGTVCGKSGTYTLNAIDNRDVDKYKLVLNNATFISLKVVADFPVKISITYMAYGCIGPSNSSSAIANPGDTASINNFFVPYSGDVIFFVAPQYVTGVPCGSNYVLKYSTVPTTYPPIPVAAQNPSSSPTQLNPIAPAANYSYYWQGTSCGASTANPASVPYPVSSTGVYYVRGQYTPLGCWTSCSSLSVTINVNRTLQVKAFIEGLYDGGGLMHEAMAYDTINGIYFEKWATGIADTVTVALYNNSYGTLMARYPAVNLHTDGNLTIPGIASSLNGSYYISVFHRNSVPITTATPQSFAGSLISYDFTTPIDKAYGAGLAPQKDLGNGLYGMYTGALDHDPAYAIDGSDRSILEPNVNIGPSGYLETDLNGDGLVDGSDLIIMEPNLNFGPIFWNPLNAKKHSIINPIK
jgi:hypothetical protein